MKYFLLSILWCLFVFSTLSYQSCSNSKADVVGPVTCEQSLEILQDSIIQLNRDIDNLENDLSLCEISMKKVDPNFTDSDRVISTTQQTVFAGEPSRADEDNVCKTIKTFSPPLKVTLSKSMVVTLKEIKTGKCPCNSLDRNNGIWYQGSRGGLSTNIVGKNGCSKSTYGVKAMKEAIK